MISVLSLVVAILAVFFGPLVARPRAEDFGRAQDTDPHPRLRRRRRCRLPKADAGAVGGEALGGIKSVSTSSVIRANGRAALHVAAAL